MTAPISPIHRRLPCGHAYVRVVHIGAEFVRRCRTCGRRFVGRVERSQASQSVGHEVLRVAWEELVA